MGGVDPLARSTCDAAADATAFHAWLISPDGGRYAPDRTQLLVDTQATKHNIQTALYNWLRQALAEDSVVIYFAGHGSPESPDSPGNLFLLPYDSDFNDIATTAFPMWDVETALKRYIKARKVVVIADACHAGGIGSEFSSVARRNLEVKPHINLSLQKLSDCGDGVAVLTAADESQLSQEGENWGGGHGVFTWFLLRGLKGEADFTRKGYVTLGELTTFVSQNVARETKNAQRPTVAIPECSFDPIRGDPDSHS